MEKEIARIRRAVSDLTLDKQILKEGVRGKFQALRASVLSSIMWWRRSVSQNAGLAVWLASIDLRSADRLHRVQMRWPSRRILFVLQNNIVEMAIAG